MAEDDVFPAEELTGNDDDVFGVLAALRGAEANLEAARASLEAAEAQLKKNIVEAEGPDAEFARRAFDRARNLFAQNLISQSALDEAHSAVDVADKSPPAGS